MQGFSCLKEVDDGGIEVGSKANANAIGERTGGTPDGGDIEGQLLCAVEVGDKPFGCGRVLEGDGESVAVDVSANGAKDNLSRLRRFIEDNVDSCGEGAFMFCVDGGVL